MRSITLEEFRELACDIAEYGSLRYAHDKGQYLADIEELNFFDGGVCVFVTGKVLVREENGVWVDAIENCPAFHRFIWKDAHCQWVEEESLEIDIVQIDSADGPIYILFSDAKERSKDVSVA